MAKYLMYLEDGETYTQAQGCVIVVVPDNFPNELPDEGASMAEVDGENGPNLELLRFNGISYQTFTIVDPEELLRDSGFDLKPITEWEEANR